MQIALPIARAEVCVTSVVGSQACFAAELDPFTSGTSTPCVRNVSSFTSALVLFNASSAVTQTLRMTLLDGGQDVA